MLELPDLTVPIAGLPGRSIPLPDPLIPLPPLGVCPLPMLGPDPALPVAGLPALPIPGPLAPPETWACAKVPIRLTVRNTIEPNGKRAIGVSFLKY